MHEIAPLLAAWESFYVIIGSSSAALTGLMFIVVTLIPESRVPSSEDGVGAFATPNVVHFCSVLLVSAILSAPWIGLKGPSLTIGFVGFAGLVYVLIVLRRARRQTAYEPVFEDWLWHMMLPFAAYGALAIAGIVLHRAPQKTLFGIAAATALLLFIGIHNAWDTVTYMAIERARERQAASGPKKKWAGIDRPIPDAKNRRSTRRDGDA